VELGDHGVGRVVPGSRSSGRGLEGGGGAVLRVDGLAGGDAEVALRLGDPESEGVGRGALAFPGDTMNSNFPIANPKQDIVVIYMGLYGPLYTWAQYTPTVRFLATATLKEYFSEQQLRLLTSYNCFTCRLVKPGGILIYSTCSIDPEENEKRITTFVQRHPVLLDNNQHGFFS
jgi:hypothetical protein